MHFADSSEVSCLLCLIQSAPNLCKLHISVSHTHFNLLELHRDYCMTNSCYFFYQHYKCHHEEKYCGCDDEKDLTYNRIEDSEDCTIDHLEIVTFSNFKGFKAEMELVKFILSHSPLLKTMSIHRNTDVKEDVALTVAEEIMQYSRASSRAQIIDLEHPVIVDDFDYDLWTYKFVA